MAKVKGRGYKEIVFSDREAAAGKQDMTTRLVAQALNDAASHGLIHPDEDDDDFTISYHMHGAVKVRGKMSEYDRTFVMGYVSGYTKGRVYEE